MITLTDEARAAMNAYRREWYKKNKDKAKAQMERYWQKKAKEAEEQQKESDANGRTE